MPLSHPALGMLAFISLAPLGCAASSRAPVMHLEPASTNASSLVAFPEYPALSPDGSILVFNWAGDLWSVPATGGNAARLTAHPATERKAAFSPDGSLLAFESDRDGARNLYVMSLTRDGTTLLGGEIVRITTSDRAQSLSGFSADGKSLYFSGLHEPELHRAARMYAVDLLPERSSSSGPAGGPIRELTTAFGSTPRATSDGQILFFRGRFDPNRPNYNGSGSLDIFSMSLSDNTFKQLSKHPNNDFDAWPGADGSILFLSSRSGQNNLWQLPTGGIEPSVQPSQLTNFQPTTDEYTIGHGIQDLAVAANGSAAVFTVWDGLYRLDLTQPGPKPERITVHVGADIQSIDFQRLNIGSQVSEAALSPDGKTMAVIARGEVFIRPMTEGRPTRRVTNSFGRERDLAWSADGSTLYFSSDEAAAGAPPGAYSIHAATVAIAREDLKPAKVEDKPVEDKPAEDSPEEGDKADGEKKSDAKKDDASKPDPGKRWAEAVTFEVKPFIVLADDARRATPSPDGKQLLYVRGRGEVMLRELAGDAAGSERLLIPTWDSGVEVIWASDSRHVIYAVNDLDFNTDIWLLDSSSADAQPVNLTRHPDNDYSPRLSADGKVLTFLSERGSGDDAIDVYQVYLDLELEGMTTYERDDYFKKAAEASGKRKPLEIKPAKAAASDDAPAKEDKPEGQPDDKPADKPADKAADKPAPKAQPAAPKPLRFDADDAYLRIRRITSSRGSESNLTMTPGGDRIIFTAPGEDGPPSLVSVDHKGQDRKVIAPGPLGGVDISLTGDRVVFVKGGAANSAPKAGGKVDSWPIEAQVQIEMSRQQRQKFLEAARVVGENFYHPTLKGLDWPKLTERYLSLAEKTRTAESFNRVVSGLFGELDGSHLGISGGSGAGGSGWTGPSISVGYLGVRVEPVEGGYRIVEITPNGPASRAGSRLAVGETIVEVDGAAFGSTSAVPTLDLSAAMVGTGGKETLLKVRGVDGADRLVLIIPAGWGEWDRLRYAQIVQQRRDQVEKLSGGRLGYLHIRGMSEASVRDFERDLYAAGKDKEGLVIDVRDNGGGSTADILLSSLTAPRHAKTQPRGVDPKDVPDDAYPRDRRLIYGWTRPINVLINQNSFSNAEIFAHAIKGIGRGRLIGTATFGGVISTGGTSLIDGTTVRLPFRGWYLPDGTDQENNGAKPDVDVPQTPQDEAAGRDLQLEAAVKDLLEQISKQ